MDSSGASSRRSKNIRMTRSFVSWSYLARMPHTLLSRGRRVSIKPSAVQALARTRQLHASVRRAANTEPDRAFRTRRGLRGSEARLVGVDAAANGIDA